MSNKKETGGPAYPCTDGESFANDGMTLRDYFASNATDKDIECYVGYGVRTKGTDEYRLITRSEARYMFADTMIKERDR